MGVVNFFPNNFAYDHLLIESFSLCQGDFSCYIKIFSQIWYIPDPTVMFLGYYECMTWRLWSYVEHGKEIIILINNTRGDFFGDYFAEDAGFHIYYYNLGKSFVHHAIIR